MARQNLRSGPWVGVLDSPDPFDDQTEPSFLQDAQNDYFTDGEKPSGACARPGRVTSTASILTTTAGQAACAFTMTSLGGTIYRFFATNGKLYREYSEATVGQKITYPANAE